MKTYKILIVHADDYEGRKKARELKTRLESEPIPEPSERAKKYIEYYNKEHDTPWQLYDKVEIFLETDKADSMNFRGFRTHRLYISKKVGMESINVKRVFIPTLTNFDSDKPILF